MKTENKNQKPMGVGRRRQFTPEFKAGAVRLVLEEGRTIVEAARDLGVHETVFGRWVRQARIDTGKGARGALTTTEREELTALRRENRVLKMERDLLKKTAILFAKGKA